MIGRLAGQLCKLLCKSFDMSCAVWLLEDYDYVLCGQPSCDWKLALHVQHIFGKRIVVWKIPRLSLFMHGIFNGSTETFRQCNATCMI